MCCILFGLSHIYTNREQRQVQHDVFINSDSGDNENIDRDKEENLLISNTENENITTWNLIKDKSFKYSYEITEYLYSFT